MKTSRKDFEIFKKECRRWIDRFGLKDWEVFYEWINLEGCRGQTEIKSLVDRIAIIQLSKNFGEKNSFNKNEIKRVAFHEVMEVFLHPYYCAVDQRYGLIKDDLEEINHKIIRTLENVILNNKGTL